MDQPLPPMDLTDPVTTEAPDVGVFTEEQAGRAVALAIAKPLLTSQGLASKTPPTVQDLITLADWMLTGSPKQQEYPYTVANVTVLGPQVIAMENGGVINWLGVNYIADEEDPPDLGDLNPGESS